jgi:hypothetical protein
VPRSTKSLPRRLRNDRTGFFVPVLGRVFGCLQPNEIAASRDLIGEFVGCLLPESPVRPTLVVFPAPSLYDLPGIGQWPRLFGQYPLGNPGLVPFDEYVSGLDKGLQGSACPRAEEGAMLRNRLLILLGGCFLTASAAWADDVGYIDCSNHPEDTQVFGKARKTPEVVTSLPCGERFTILIYGFIFSRIQTRDGKVGYVYSNLIAVDRSAASVQPPASARLPAATSNLPRTTATVVQPNPTTLTQPQPTPAQPAAPAIRAASARTSLEKPFPSVRKAYLVELFGGYAFARLDGAGTGSNLNGALGSFGWNAKPWLQIVADSSYSVVTASGTKNVLYGNHYGPRFFRRGRNRWGATPFVEALFGGSRADTTVSGSGGYTSSDSSFSIKVGGGLDINPSRRFEIRLFDVDYYRTSFGLNVHQNNYWASTGIVLRLFGGGSE